MSYRRVLAPAVAALAAGALIGLALSGWLTSEAVQNPTISLDMDPTGNSYSDPGAGGNNSMAVGSLDNCLTTAAPGNNNAHSHVIHVVIKNVEDLIGWQARVNYLGTRWRPNAVNFAPFTDSNTLQNISFLNLPIDPNTLTHRDLSTSSSIPAAAPGPQTAAFGSVYSGMQNYAVSPDSPAKPTPDNTSYSAPNGGVLAAVQTSVLSGNVGSSSLFLNLDDDNPNGPGSGVSVFNGTESQALYLPSSALGDAFHGEGATCVPLDCTNQDCPEPVYPIGHTFTNGTGQTASDLHVTFSGPIADAQVLSSAPGCPVPTVIFGSTNVDVQWGAACVDDGESVVLGIISEPPATPQSFYWTIFGNPIGTSTPTPGGSPTVTPAQTPTTTATAPPLGDLRMSLDMDPSSNSYSDPGAGGDNSMTVGTIDDCLTSAAPGNNALHIHQAQVIVQNVRDLVGWQARFYYDGGKMRPLTVNFTPFMDTASGQNISFVNLPLQSAQAAHREMTVSSSIPPAAPGAQTAIFGSAYLGPQAFAVSPDTPPKSPADDSSYRALFGGVLATVNLQVLAGNAGQQSLLMNMDDNNPNTIGSGMSVFDGARSYAIDMPSAALGDGYHGEGVTCVPQDCTNVECSAVTTPTKTPSPVPTLSPTPTPTPTMTPSATPTPTPTPTVTPNSQIGEGSCSGDRACEGLTGTVGDNSCNGFEACLNASAAIGDNSCNGENSCPDTGGSMGDGSCSPPGVHDGSTWACAGSTGEIGNNSCLAPFGCYVNHGQIGNDSCNTGEETCTDNTGKIGDHSCQGLNCLFNSGEIGNHSCNGGGNCSRNSGKIGHHSCSLQQPVSGYGADCGGNTGSIGNRSCNEVRACPDNSGDIGNKSCNAELACVDNTGIIGNNRCNTAQECIGTRSRTMMPVAWQRRSV